MKIKDIRNNHISPFEIQDGKLMKLFSFFLHSAPTIKSDTAMKIDAAQLEKNWKNFIAEFDNKKYTIISDNCKIEDYLANYNLDDQCDVNKRSKGFVCKRHCDEKDYECVLRHIRNAIAHSRVFMLHTGNRIFILFEDRNDKSNNRNSIILFSQTDLDKLKKEISKSQL